ncbi:MAG TPA: hypothetical protein VLK65_13250 [Vicinamibacteria bacterium]|nr:hypothetical protein [Vicinamibacteria bacterium]
MIVSGLLAGWLTLPATVLWAWERPEDLSFVDPTHMGVAYLAATVRLGDGEDVDSVPRLQPLVVPRAASVIPVIRVESPRDRRPSLSEKQGLALVRAIDAVIPLREARALQIDFDARLSERTFFRSFLEMLRSELPEDSFLSITALTSWCLDDPWLDGLPVDEAVPMLFRMGDHADTIRARLDSGVDFGPTLCRASAGISTDEPIPSLPAGRRYYVFHPGIWSADVAERALTIVQESRR